MAKKLAVKKPDKDEEVFMAMPAFKWVKCKMEEKGFQLNGSDAPYKLGYFKLQQAWRGDRETIVWKDVKIEL